MGTPIRKLLAARRQMVDAPYRQRFDGVDLPDGGWMPTNRRIEPRIVARDGSGLELQDDAFLRLLTREILEKDPDTAGLYTAGFYAPEYHLVAYPDAKYTSGSPRSLRRHEVMHAYNHAARQGVAGMPLASRVLAKLPGGLARPMDELVASRVGGKAALDVPWDFYANKYLAEGNSQAARVARALHAAQKARNAARSAGRAAAENPGITAAALGTGGGVLYGLSLEDDPNGH
jgi:hypothetical protein